MNDILNKLDIMIPNPKCELIYNKDYELLIATLLSAQTTDKKVNKVTKVLFNKYDIYSLCNANILDLEDILRSLGTHKKKAIYIKEVANMLVNDYNGKVPNNRAYLEKLPGVGHKTANLVLSDLFNIPSIAVDTHVTRVSKRIGIAKETDDVKVIENKLMKKIPKEKWGRTHHQLVLFGRYICKAKNPECNKCLLHYYCKYKKS